MTWAEDSDGPWAVLHNPTRDGQPIQPLYPVTPGLSDAQRADFLVCSVLPLQLFAAQPDSLAWYEILPSGPEGWGAEAERAWRTAHLEGLLNGMLVVVLGALTPLLRFAGREERWYQLGALATGYGNVAAATLAAVAGVRGLAPGGPLANWVVYGPFLVAIVGVVGALAIALRAAARARA